jgi:hypothetical protein
MLLWDIKISFFFFIVTKLRKEDQKVEEGREGRVKQNSSVEKRVEVSGIFIRFLLGGIDLS